MTDAEQRSALAIVRSLGRAGHRVVVSSPRRRPLAAASRFCRGSVQLPDPLEDVEAFRSAVVDTIEKERIDLVIPTTDVSVVGMMPLAAQIEGTTFALPDPDAYRALSDKQALIERAGRIGLPAPEQVVISRFGAGTSDAGAWARERGFDVVVKSSRSVVEHAGRLRSFGVSLSRSEEGFWAALMAYPPEAYPLLVQERLTGAGEGVFLLTVDGETKAAFAHRRLREKPPTGGVSVYRESVTVPDKPLEHAKELLRGVRWTGVAMVEFKRDDRSGEAHLMEVNGRFWGSLQLAVDAGVDFPLLAASAAMGQDIAVNGDYRTGIRSRWLWGDFDHLLWMVTRGRRHRRGFPHLPSTMGALGRFMVPWRPGDRLEVLRLSDPVPFLRESVDWARHAFRRE